MSNCPKVTLTIGLIVEECQICKIKVKVDFCFSFYILHDLHFLNVNQRPQWFRRDIIDFCFSFYYNIVGRSPLRRMLNAILKTKFKVSVNFCLSQHQTPCLMSMSSAAIGLRFWRFWRFWRSELWSFASAKIWFNYFIMKVVKVPMAKNTHGHQICHQIFWLTSITLPVIGLPFWHRHWI
jgi:hypothetical protein